MLSCEQVGARYISGRCGNVLLSSICVWIALVVIAWFAFYAVLVLRPSFIVNKLSQSPPAAPDTGAATHSLHGHRETWTFAQLLSIFRRQILEYFNPTERPRPLCPMAGKLIGYVM